MNKRDINGIHETVISDLGKLFEKFDGIGIIKRLLDLIKATSCLLVRLQKQHLT